LQQKELYRLCGLQPYPSAPPRRWVPAQLQFIGAEGYVLSSKRIEVCIEPGRDGICLTTRGRLSVKSNSLLGKHVKHARLFDVQVVTESVTMSLAKLRPGMYPLVLRDDEVVTLN